MKAMSYSIQMSHKSNFDTPALPSELLVEVACYLPLTGLRNFRLSSRQLARAGYDSLVPFMRDWREYVAPQPEDMELLIKLSTTLKLRDTLSSLGLARTEPSVNTLLLQIQLPRLQHLSIHDTSMEASSMGAFLCSHAYTLEDLCLVFVTLFTSTAEIQKRCTSGWSTILRLIKSDLHLDHFYIDKPKYSCNDEEFAMIAHPAKYIYDPVYSDHGKDDDVQYWIGSDYAKAINRRDVLHVVDAFVDETGTEEVVDKNKVRVLM